MDYVTLSELKNSQELVGVSFADFDALKAIPAASRAIENLTGQPTFGTQVATRYYTPYDTRILNIDALVTVGQVKLDLGRDGSFSTDWVQNTDYILEPLNAPLDGRPYDTLRAHSYGGYNLPCWPRSVSISGTFGFPAVPNAVYAATLIVAVQTVKRIREAPFGVVGFGVDNVAVRISASDPQIAMLLETYMAGDGVLAA